MSEWITFLDLKWLRGGTRLFTTRHTPTCHTCGQEIPKGTTCVQTVVAFPSTGPTFTYDCPTCRPLPGEEVQRG